MQIPVYRDWQDDEVVTPQMLNEQVRDGGKFHLNPPICVVRTTDANGIQTVPTGATQKIVWNVTDVDNDNIWQAGSNTMLVNTPGFYNVSVMLGINGGTTATGESRAYLKTDSASSPMGEWLRNEKWVPLEGNGRHTMELHGVIRCEQGDLLWVDYYQTTGTDMVIRDNVTPSRWSAQWCAGLTGA